MADRSRAYGPKGKSTRGERDHRAEVPRRPTFGDMRLALVTLAVCAAAACSDRHDREAAAVDSAAAPSPELARVDTGITHPADSSPGPATTPAEESPPPVATVTQPRPRRHPVRHSAPPAYRAPEPDTS